MSYLSKISNYTSSKFNHLYQDSKLQKGIKSSISFGKTHKVATMTFLSFAAYNIALYNNAASFPETLCLETCKAVPREGLSKIFDLFSSHTVCEPTPFGQTIASFRDIISAYW